LSGDPAGLPGPNLYEQCSVGDFQVPASPWKNGRLPQVRLTSIRGRSGGSQGIDPGAHIRLEVKLGSEGAEGRMRRRSRNLPEPHPASGNVPRNPRPTAIYAARRKLSSSCVMAASVPEAMQIGPFTTASVRAR
jgi:hypothetical protein